MGRAFAEWKEVVGSRKARNVWLILATITGVTGPFGSYHDMALPVRLIYWPLVVAAAIGLGAAVRIIVREVLGITGFWRGAVVVAVLNMAVFTPLLVLISPMASAGGVPTAAEFASFVLVGSLGMSAIRVVLGVDRHGAEPPAVPRAASPADAPHPADEPVSQGEPVADGGSRLIGRLPEPERGALIRISGLNHHVEIHTEHGISKILLRFADAVAEAAPTEGLQVHRSHWVAVDSVRGLERRAGRTVLVMVDGAEVPVSRNYRDAVATAGFG
ncbi:LytTR family DNA-binding domain-containing protein [Frigidibacter sp. MR17.24]|uniref:LytTR family DNA-binding domain-containing protein n=1 Tax=Frigidibacter sp. MR17.24 TaxID=3127345 RepID=UPI0030130C58